MFFAHIGKRLCAPVLPGETPIRIGARHDLFDAFFRQARKIPAVQALLVQGGQLSHMPDGLGCTFSNLFQVFFQRLIEVFFPGFKPVRIGVQRSIVFSGLFFTFG